MAFHIDHLITLTQDRDGARASLTRMGFDLTERGEHPGRGTSNHLAFFGRCYWELLCVDTPTPENAALRERGSGLAGCALRTGDAARDAQLARTLGAEAGEMPISFSASTSPLSSSGRASRASIRMGRSGFVPCTSRGRASMRRAGVSKPCSVLEGESSRRSPTIRPETIARASETARCPRQAVGRGSRVSSYRCATSRGARPGSRSNGYPFSATRRRYAATTNSSATPSCSVRD